MTAKKTIMILAIAILFAFFVGYGVQTLYPEPKYEDYCKTTMEPKFSPNQIITQELCEANGGDWIAQDIRCVTTPCPQGYCDYYTKCQAEYDNARDAYDGKVSVLLGIIGLAAVFIGIKGPMMENYISAGIMLGGVITLIHGTVRYWPHFTDITRFFVIGIFLGLLIYLGTKYKKFFK